jgi:hypothetical protein
MSHNEHGTVRRVHGRVQNIGPRSDVTSSPRGCVDHPLSPVETLLALLFSHAAGLLAWPRYSARDHGLSMVARKLGGFEGVYRYCEYLVDRYVAEIKTRTKPTSGDRCFTRPEDLVECSDRPRRIPQKPTLHMRARGRTSPWKRRPPPTSASRRRGRREGWVGWSLIAERQPSGADYGSGLPRCCVIQQMLLLLFLLRRRWCVLLHTTSPFTSRQHPRIHTRSLWPVAPSSHDVELLSVCCLHSACDGD